MCYNIIVCTMHDMRNIQPYLQKMQTKLKDEKGREIKRVKGQRKMLKTTCFYNANNNEH